MSFVQAFDYVIGEEGGYTNDPQDPGGETRWGISKRQYPEIDIANLTIEQARAIYLRDYWQPLQADQLPYPLALCLFDMAVNSGVPQAIRTLQRAIDVPVDGIMGPGTLGKALSLPESILVAYMQAERVIYLTSLPTFQRFGRGWVRRTFSTAHEAFA